jgi:nucleoid-associated protein YgaU
MTGRRLILTAGAMAAISAALRTVAPGPAATVRALAAPQHLADTAGAGVLVVAVVGGLAWLAWAWGALGLLLTAATALPGMVGRAAGLVLRGVLPAGARRAAALALGVGVALHGPLLAGVALASPATPGAPSAGTGLPVPDWPAEPARTAPTGAGQPAVPDWPPAGPSTGGHVVVRGDCLWDIAADHLSVTAGRSPTDAEVAGAVRAWWSVNAGVIGPDPDLLLPGQVLHPPGS